MTQWGKDSAIKKKWVNDPWLRDSIEGGEFTLQEVLDFPESVPTKRPLLEWMCEYITLTEEAKAEIEKEFKIIESTEVFGSFEVERSNEVEHSERVVGSSQVLYSGDVENSRIILNSDNVWNSSHVSYGSEIVGQAIFNSSFVYDSLFVVNSLNIRHSILVFNCKAATNLILCQNMTNKDADKYYFRNDEIPKESFERMFKGLEHTLRVTLSKTPHPFDSWWKIKNFVEPSDSNLQFYYSILLHYDLVAILQKSLGNKIKTQELYEILMMSIMEK